MATVLRDAPGESLAGTPPRGPRLGPLGWLRWGWRILTSMRTALWLLGLLAVAAIPGSLLPQRGTDPGAVLAYFRENPGLAPVLDRLSLFDVFGAPWFEAVYLLLFVSLTGCVLPRSLRHVRRLRARPAPPPRRLSGETSHAYWTTATPPEAVLDAAYGLLRGNRRWWKRYVADRLPDAVAAEKGRLRELGNLAFHLSLLALLVAVAIGHLFGYRANVAVPEGQGFTNSIVQFDTFTSGPAVGGEDLSPFSVRLDRLDARFQESGGQLGAARDFAAHVRWSRSPTPDPASAVISPNSPLVIDGTKVFLLGQGYAPRFTVRDGSGAVVFSGPVVLLPQEGDPNLTSTGAIKVPDSVPEQLGFEVTFLPTTARVPSPDGTTTAPVSIFPDARVPRVVLTAAWRGDLGLDEGAPQSVYRLDTARMSRLDLGGQPVTAELAPGNTVTLPDGLGTLTFDGVGRFAAFSLAADPGRRWALAAGILALAGLMASLYLRPRRLWVRARRGSDGHTVVEVAAAARSDYPGLTAETNRLIAELQKRTAPPVTAPPHPDPTEAPEMDSAWTPR